MIGESKDDIGYLIENDLNITQTMNDWLNKVKSKYDFYSLDNYTNAIGITNITSLTTEISKITTEANETNYFTTTLTNTDKYNESTTSDDLIYDDESSYSNILTTSLNETTTDSLIANSTTSNNIIDSSTNSFTTFFTQSSKYYKVHSYYFTGILFNHIIFDDTYWLNGFKFESSRSGTIKIGVNNTFFLKYFNLA